MKALYLLLGLSLTHLASAASVNVQPVYGTFGQTNLSSLRLSLDGSTVVGFERSEPFVSPYLFRWRSGIGAEQIVLVPGNEGHGVYATSADGNVAVGGIGTFSTPFTARPYVWSETNGMRLLDNMGPAVVLTPFDYATDVSPDGGVVVTRSNEVGYFTWSESDGYNAIGLQYVNDISNNGEYIVGVNSLGQGVLLSSTGPTIIGSTPVVPLAITPDGGWVAGTWRQTGPFRDSLFLWNAATGYLDLGLIRGTSGIGHLLDISNDGKTILGSRAPDVPTSSDYFVWTADKGIRDFSEMMLTDYGFDITPYTNQYGDGSVRGMSGDGRTFLFGSNAGYYLFTIVPEPSCLAISAIAATALLSSRRERRL